MSFPQKRLRGMPHADHPPGRAMIHCPRERDVARLPVIALSRYTVADMLADHSMSTTISAGFILNHPLQFAEGDGEGQHSRNVVAANGHRSRDQIEARRE